MKLKICIILTILLSATFGYSQPKLITREELDKRQVKKFVDEFMKSFFDTNDLNDMPDKFFTDDFKSNLIKSNDEFAVNEDAFKELTKDQQIRYQLSVLSLFNAVKIWSISKKDFDINMFEGMEDEEILKNALPSEVLAILNNSRVFRTFVKLEKEDEENPITYSDLIETIQILRNTNSMFKNSIDSRDADWRDFYAINIKVMIDEIKRFDNYNAETCKSVECFGRPEKTKVFYQELFPLCLHIIRENGKLKIFNIHINVGD
jgi:hypothetical protein